MTTATHQPYTGIKTLENLSSARNYNHFLEIELLQFISPNRTTLDFGAGTGEFAHRLSSHQITVDCIEADGELRSRLTKEGFRCIAAPEDDLKVYDRIYSLNVLEHIEDDATALNLLRDKLSAGGKLFIFVPAFMCLYSDFDKFIGHYRRYTIPDLRQKIETTGFSIERIEYVDSIGFIAWWLLRLLPNSKTKILPFNIWLFDRCVFPISRLCDKLLRKLLGKNVLCIARKL